MWNRLSNCSIEFQRPFELKELNVITKPRKHPYILNLYDNRCKTGQIFMVNAEHNINLKMRLNCMKDLDVQYYQAAIYSNRLMLTYADEDLKAVLKELQDESAGSNEN